MVSRDPLANPEPLIRRVYSYAAYRLGDGPEAEDVTSETFERALRYRGSYDSSRGEPGAWLVGIARRCVDDALATRRREVADAVPLLARDTVENDAIENDVIERVALARALAALDDRDRDLIALRYGADFTAARIGDLLGLRANAVDVALARARARLADRLSAGTGATPANGGKDSAPCTGINGERIDPSKQEAG